MPERFLLAKLRAKVLGTSLAAIHLGGIMGTIVNPRWDDRKSFIVQKWPLLSEKDLETLQKHPENIVVKLQKHYHYSKFQAYEAYFEMMDAEEHLTTTSRVPN